MELETWYFEQKEGWDSKTDAEKGGSKQGPNIWP